MLPRLPALAPRFRHIACMRPTLRYVSTSKPLLHGGFERQDAKNPEDVVMVNIIDKGGNTHSLKGKVGDNLLYLCHRYQDENPKVALEGACEASLACSTCHVIVDDAYFDLLPDPVEEEDDMLDEASCLTSTSRLGCQIILNKELDGITLTIPAFSKNFYVDGHTPTPH